MVFEGDGWDSRVRIVAGTIYGWDRGRTEAGAVVEREGPLRYDGTRRVTIRRASGHKLTGFWWDDGRDGPDSGKGPADGVGAVEG